MSTPSWAEVEKFLDDQDLSIAPWQKAMVASMLSGPSGQPVSFDLATPARGWGKALCDRWAMFAANAFSLHTHFVGPHQTICVAREPACPDTVAYDPVEMKP